MERVRPEAQETPCPIPHGCKLCVVAESENFFGVESGACSQNLESSGRDPNIMAMILREPPGAEEPRKTGANAGLKNP